MLSALLFALTSPALAAPLLENVDPGFLSGWVAQTDQVDPDDPQSLEDYSGQFGFLRLTSQGMFEQAHAMQHLSNETSALISGGEGIQLGVQLNTFPFGTIDNKVGKTENTQYSPVFPLLQAGYGGVSDGGLSYRFGFAFSPPVTVGGATAHVLGADASVAGQLTPWLRAGGELDYTVGEALAPVVAAKSQAEGCVWNDDGTVANPADCDLSNTPAGRYLNVCEPQEFGCIDTLFFTHMNLRAALLFQPTERLQPFLKVGALVYQQTFSVQVDLSKWRLTGVLPTGTVGVAYVLGERWRVSGSATGTYRPFTYSEEGAGLFSRYQVGVSYAL